MKTRKFIKSKSDYLNMLEDMIIHYSLPENRDMFDYKRYIIEHGFLLGSFKEMCRVHEEIRNLYIEAKHIILDTLTRMILENKIVKDAFAVRTMKLMFKDLYYHTEEEKEAIYKLRSERELNDATSQDIQLRIGFADDD